MLHPRWCCFGHPSPVHQAQRELPGTHLLLPSLHRFAVPVHAAGGHLRKKVVDPRQGCHEATLQFLPVLSPCALLTLRCAQLWGGQPHAPSSHEAADCRGSASGGHGSASDLQASCSTCQQLSGSLPEHLALPHRCLHSIHTQPLHKHTGCLVAIQQQAHVWKSFCWQPANASRAVGLPTPEQFGMSAGSEGAPTDIRTPFTSLLLRSGIQDSFLLGKCCPVLSTEGRAEGTDRAR